MKTINFKLTLLFVFLNICVSKGQFNEALAKEIASLDERFNLNGIEKIDALNTLEEISSDIPESTIEIMLPGKTWKYSHSVNNKGRQYRVSNAIKRLDFSSNGNSFFTKGKKEAPVTSYCKWEYSVDFQLRLDLYENEERTSVTGTYYFGVHSATVDRLVITKIIQSKESPGKSAILFQVYFR
ncbi:MAG: hypothetical protein ABJF11_18650 [Reichenbachiella sp.]|uniref:hypothetical protein n=1 Tax=Reichenbachiella sp. TaxID=2184521 RepID=UPI003264F0F6